MHPASLLPFLILLLSVVTPHPKPVAPDSLVKVGDFAHVGDTFFAPAYRMSIYDPWRNGPLNEQPCVLTRGDILEAVHVQRDTVMVVLHRVDPPGRSWSCRCEDKIRFWCRAKAFVDGERDYQATRNRNSFQSRRLAAFRKRTEGP